VGGVREEGLGTRLVLRVLTKQHSYEEHSQTGIKTLRHTFLSRLHKLQDACKGQRAGSAISEISAPKNA
jgi:hypothetical protein